MNTDNRKATATSRPWGRAIIHLFEPFSSNELRVFTAPLAHSSTDPPAHGEPPIIQRAGSGRSHCRMLASSVLPAHPYAMLPHACSGVTLRTPWRHALTRRRPASLSRSDAATKCIGACSTRGRDRADIAVAIAAASVAVAAAALTLAATAVALAATAVAAASVAVAAVIEGGRALLANFRQECSFRTRIFPRTSTVISCGAVPRSVNSRLATRGPRWPRRS